MPAFPQERNRAINEGVKFLILTQPLDYVVNENNVLKGVVVAPSRLGKSDKSGRRTPQIIPNCTYVVEVDLVIEALGQIPCDNISKIFPGLKFDNNGLIVNLKDSRATDRERIYAGGDIVNGGSTAVQAIADGRQAAEEIHRYLEKNKWNNLFEINVDSKKLIKYNEKWIKKKCQKYR